MWERTQVSPLVGRTGPSTPIKLACEYTCTEAISPQTTSSTIICVVKFMYSNYNLFLALSA